MHGGYGSTPKLTFPAVAGPSHLESKALSVGKGPVVKSHDLIAVNYLGQIWRGKVFDSSFKRKQLFGTAIGVSQVIKGWDQSLVGADVGSRMLLVIPPAEGYGPSGNSGAGISGSDTLVFVIDLVAAYPSTGGAQFERERPPLERERGTDRRPPRWRADGQRAEERPGPQDPRRLGGRPRPRAEGEGGPCRHPVRRGLLGEPDPRLHLEGGRAGGRRRRRHQRLPSYYDPLIGIPVGSRVLLEIPKTSQGGPYAVVIDVLGQPSEPKGS